MALNLEQKLFSETEEERLFRQGIAQSVKKVIGPLAQRIMLANDFDKPTYEAAFRAMQSQGCAALGIPEEYDGLPSPSRSWVTLTEEISSVDGSIGLVIGASNSLVASPIAIFGTKEQKQQWLPKFAAGSIIGCYCQTEPDAGSDVAGIKTKAVLRDGRWYITGEKHYITNGATANVALVLARTSAMDPQNRHRGLTMFIVDMDRAKAAKQVNIPKNRAAERKAGLHNSPTTYMSFDECEADDVLGKPDDGFRVAMTTLVGSRSTVIGAQGVGIARGAWRIADTYARSPRTQFGLQLVQISDIQRMLLLQEMGIAAAHLLVVRASVLKDHFAAKNPQDTRPLKLEASVAKLVGSEVAEWGPSAAMQILGGFGYMMESGIPKFWHDGRVVPIYEGTSGIQRLIIGEDALARAFREVRSKFAFLKWSFTGDWIFGIAEEEAEFLARAKHAKGKEARAVADFFAARTRLVELLQSAYRVSPPNRNASSMPLVWYFVTEAFVGLEAARMLLWKTLYHAQNGKRQLARFRGHYAWGMLGAKSKIHELEDALAQLPELEAACALVARETISDEDLL